MRISAAGRLRRAVLRVRNRFEDAALILLYHRVAELPSDPHFLCVTPKHFAEHLEILRKGYRPMPLRELVAALRDGDLPRRAVVLTFDDGYADNLHNAKPLLERYDVPGAVFVTTGSLDRKREFWWDELDRLLLETETLPETLTVNIHGRTYRWQSGDEDSSEWRQHLLRSLHQLLRPLPDTEQQRVLHRLAKWTGMQSSGRLTHRALTSEELCHLAEGTLVEIGAHTVTHPVLSVLSQTEQRLEIQGSKRHLEELLGHSVSSFAYPYGSLSDYTPETVNVVRESGFSCACSNFVGVVRRYSDLFQLPRVMVLNWDGDEFARNIGECIG